MDIVDSSFLAIIIVMIKGGTLRYEWTIECVIANIPLYNTYPFRKRSIWNILSILPQRQQFYP